MSCICLWKILLPIVVHLGLSEGWSRSAKDGLRRWLSYSLTFAIYGKHRISRCIFNSSSLSKESPSSYSPSYGIIIYFLYVGPPILCKPISISKAIQLLVGYISTDRLNKNTFMFIISFVYLCYYIIYYC